MEGGAAVTYIRHSSYFRPCQKPGQTWSPCIPVGCAKPFFVSCIALAPSCAMLSSQGSKNRYLQKIVKWHAAAALTAAGAQIQWH